MECAVDHRRVRVPTMPAITFATYNIHYGVGLDGRCDLERIARAVRDADVIGLQEVDRHWARSGDQDQLARLGELLPGRGLAWGPNVDVLKTAADGSPTPPHVRRQFGNLILSKFPIVSVRNHLLPRYGAAAAMDMQRGALEAVILAPGRPLRVYCTHLCHLSESQREIQARFLIDVHERATREGPVLSGVHPADPSWSQEKALPPMPAEAVILGDFNAEPGSKAYAVLVGDETRRFGTLTRCGGFVDAWRAAGHRDGAPGSEGSLVPGATSLNYAAAKTGRRIDFCFVSQPLATCVRSARVVTDADGSDHLPLIVAVEVS
jgi:endonuclease/exonuclease/phosphatase family metal-dependent hydrolase